MIFLLGLHKTGTSSLANALAHLGYKIHQDKIARGDSEAERIVANHDGSNRRGFPFVAFPSLLRRKYPEAKFILTLRDYSSWSESVLRNFGGTKHANHTWFYDEQFLTKDNIIQKHKEHVAFVREVFKDKPDNYLEMNIIDGDGWDKLCSFMGVDVPNIPFMWDNKTTK